MSDDEFEYEVECNEDYDYFGDEQIEKEEKNFEVLTKDEIVRQQQELVKTIADLFAVPDTTARQLLSWIRWSKDKLIERYSEGEADKIFKESGIVNPAKKKKLKKIDRKSTLQCTICFDDVKASRMKRAPCGHNFCKDCWKGFVLNKISEGLTKITCPYKGCKVVLDDTLIERFLDTSSKERYHRLLLQEYVTSSKNIRWCPGVNCDKAIRVQLLKDREIVCACGTKFCFGCGELPHDPADCKMLIDWNLKNQKEGDDAKWFATYTKECPKCKAVIHKDGGCQYMRCGQCNHAFCWMCLGAFDHKDHACNQLKEESGVDPNSERAQLNKYVFFFGRFQVHHQSLQLENSLTQKAEKMMQDLSKDGMSWMDAQFIKNATLTLKECRNMLKYTYVYGFFLPKSVNRSIFEYLQADLEASVEKLSQLLESDLVKEQRIKVINATEEVKKKQKNFLTGLMEGEITGKGGDEDLKVYKNTNEVYDGWVYTAGR